MTTELILSIIAVAIAAGAAVAAIYSAYYAKVSMKQQRDQWINQEYIKREADVLLEFRNAIMDSMDSINWVYHTLLFDQSLTHFILGTESSEKIQIVSNHYKTLGRLKNLYNSNQLIFRKHHLDEKLPHLFAVIDVIELLAFVFEMTPINNVFDEKARHKIIMEMRPDLFKEIMDSVMISNRGITAEQLCKLDTDRDIAHTITSFYITFSLGFFITFSVGSLAKTQWGKGHIEELEKYREPLNKYLTANKYAFHNQVTNTWKEYENELKNFLFGMDEKTTFEGKIPDDIRELEKLSYPHAEKMFVVKDDQTQK